MGKSSTMKKIASFYLRKHRKWPHSPYKARWQRNFNQQQAMRALKQAARTPPAAARHQEASLDSKPHLLSSLIHSFSIYNCEPTPQAYRFLITTLAKAAQFHHIPAVLDHLEKVEKFETPEFIFADLIQIYGKANQFQNAIDLFFRIPNLRCVPTVGSLHALLSVLCQNSEGLKWVPEILSKSQEMKIRLEESTYHILITALCRIKKVGGAIDMLNCMVNDGLDIDEKMCSLLLSSLCEQKHVSGVQVLGVLGQLKKFGFYPGMIDYSRVIRFLVKEGMGMDAFAVFNQMKSEGIKPDIVCYTMVLNGVIADGDFSKADELFDELLVFGLVPDVYAYNAYINGLCRQNNVEAGIKMVASMQELGCKPNLVTYNMLMEGLCKVGELSSAKEILREMRSKGIGLNAQTYRIMINSLASNGKIIEACALLENVLKKGQRSQSLSFDEIIYGLCQRRLISEALELTKKMANANVSPGVRVWEALILSSELKDNVVEAALVDLVENKLTQPS